LGGFCAVVVIHIKTIAPELAIEKTVHDAEADEQHHNVKQLASSKADMVPNRG